MAQNNFSQGPYEITGLGALPLENVQPPQLVVYPNPPLQSQINFSLGCIWVVSPFPYQVWMLVNKAQASNSNPTPVHWIQLYQQTNGFVTYTVTTVNATPTPIASFPIPAGHMVTINATISAIRSDFSAGLYGFAVFGARNNGINTYLVDIGTVSFGDDALGAPSLDSVVVGDNMELLVTGESLTTWHWTATILTVTT